MFKHKVIDTIGAISALILGVALSASSALAMRFPDPVGGAGVAQPPLQQTASAPSGTLSPSLIVAVIAVIALVALVTQAFTHRHSTSHA